MSQKPESYIPALRFRQLTPFYDPLSKWVMREDSFKRQLIRTANLQPGQQVLDLGSGTGTLTVLAKRLHPGIHITGLDGDATVLEIARQKANLADVEIRWDKGLASELPYEAESFDRVLSSLMFHHLTKTDKRRAFFEAYRVLKPGGEMVLVDFGKPSGWLMSVPAATFGWMEQAADNFKGLLPILMREAGFASVKEEATFPTVFGSVSIYSGQKTLRDSSEHKH